MQHCVHIKGNDEIGQFCFLVPIYCLFAQKNRFPVQQIEHFNATA